MSGAERRIGKKGSTGRVVVVGLLVAAALGIGLTYASSRWFGRTAEVEIKGARVRRGPLKISVLQRGELSAKNSVSIKSEIEGQTTILQLVAEGTVVEKGELLVRLDSSDLVEKELQQRIARDNAEAAYKKAKAQYEIQVSQNQSDIEAADRKLKFAELDLNKYREGDLEQLRKADEDKILLAEQKRSQSETTLGGPRRCTRRASDADGVDKDDLDAQSSDVQLKQAKLAPSSSTSTRPEEQSQLEADLLERSAAPGAKPRPRPASPTTRRRSTSEARLKLESDKLAKYEEQLAKTKITAPVGGMVVYRAPRAAG